MKSNLTSGLRLTTDCYWCTPRISRAQPQSRIVPSCRLKIMDLQACSVWVLRSPSLQLHLHSIPHSTWSIPNEKQSAGEEALTTQTSHNQGSWSEDTKQERWLCRACPFLPVTFLHFCKIYKHNLPFIRCHDEQTNRNNPSHFNKYV